MTRCKRATGAAAAANLAGQYTRESARLQKMRGVPPWLSQTRVGLCIPGAVS